MPEHGLLERDDLLDTLMGHVDDARGGIGSLVLVAGEAGSGKTSLTRAHLEQIGQRALTLVGSCDPLSTPRPLGPLRDFATDESSGLGDLLEGERDNIEIFNTVLARLRHTIRPIIMVIEDIHWGDQATLDFLRFIGRRVGASKGVIVCTYRDDETGPDHPLRQVLGQLMPLPSTLRLTVPPLSPKAVTALAEGTDMDPVELHRVTGGNAFYVTEVIAGGHMLPATVQDAVVGRVARLEQGPRRVVEAVSIAPRSLGVRQAMELVRATTSQVDEAVASGVILGDGTSLRFRHELARSAVEESIPPARRFAMHTRMIALLLEDDPPDHAGLAHHAIGAEQPELVVEYAPEAAERASRRGSHKEAIDLLEAALENSRALDSEDEMTLRLSLAKELGIVDRHQDALEYAKIAVGHYRKLKQPRELANALMTATNALWRTSDTEGSRAAIDEALELLEPLGSSPDLAYALYMSAYQYMLARKVGLATSHIERARAMAKQTGTDEILWDIEMIRGTIEIVLGQPLVAAKMLEASVTDAKRRYNRGGVTVALSMLGSGGGEARIYDRALPALVEAVQWGLANDHDYNVAYARAWLARMAFEQGRWDEAVETAELVDHTSVSREGISIVTARGALGRVGVRRGDTGGREVLEEVVRLGKQHELQHVWSPICGLAEYHWLTGDTEAMLPILEKAYGRALGTDSEWARGEVGFWMWKAGAIDAPPPGAARPFQLQMLGRWKEAAEAWREFGCPYEVGLALAEGDEGALLEALSIFDSLGARPAGNLVRARLRDLGVDRIPRGPTRETTANPAGLTGRELEVFRLIIGGMTNREISESLFITKKTVEHHVSAIYSKLGVRTRSKAIAEGGRLGISAS